MRILDYLTGPQGRAAIDNVAKSFGLAPDEAKAAVGAIVPEFAHAIERNTLNRGGIADFVAALGKANPAATLGDDSELASPAVSSTGTEFLEQMLGTKDKSRKVAAQVSRETGVDYDVIKKMLPAVAAMTMAALAKGSRSSIEQVAGRTPALQAAGIPKQTRLPIPGNNLPDIEQSPSPYDKLPDVIRRGGQTVPRSSGGSGGSPGSVVRDILGGLLGFQNRGFLGWLVQVVVLPMILRLIQSMLRRVLGGR